MLIYCEVNAVAGFVREWKARCVVYALPILLCTCLGAQGVPARPQFEVASVKPVPNGQLDDSDVDQALRKALRNTMRTGKIPMANPDRVELQHWSLLDLIAAAYRVRVSQVSGPDWLSDANFDIAAKVPVGAPKEELNAMLQSLLEERFALRVHRITEPKRGYALTVAKGGPRLKPAEPPLDSSRELTDEEKKKQAMNGLAAISRQMQIAANQDHPAAGMTIRSWSSITLEELAHRLDEFTEAPVADQTGLTGNYAVTIEISNRPDGFGNTIFDAVEKLGLKLEPRRVLIEIVTVDRVSRNPTPN